MSDIYPNDSKRRATGTKAADTERACVQYGLLGPCVAFALLVGEGEGHYAALSAFCSALRSAA